jgi:hypothetical protein
MANLASCTRITNDEASPGNAGRKSATPQSRHDPRCPQTHLESADDRLWLDDVRRQIRDLIDLGIIERVG